MYKNEPSSSGGMNSRPIPGRMRRSRTTVVPATLSASRSLGSGLRHTTRALVGETDLAIDRQRVMAKYALVNESDYFTLLGVRRDATSFEIRRAYEAARRDYALVGFPPELQRELAEPLGEITRVIEEAYQVLREAGAAADARNPEPEPVAVED